jgi:glucose-1-phosphate cytidylyltransferase
MKAIILAGGLGTRISEESHLKIYSAAGINDFVICLGYRGYVIKEYFANYFLHMSDVTFDMVNNKMEVHQNNAEPWRVTLVDTGEDTMTGGRLKNASAYVGDEDFCFTYGDGVSDLDMGKLVAFHKQNKTLATVTAVQPPGRFGALNLKGDLITSFEEKPKGDGGWINGGFFVLSPKVIDYVTGSDTVWERDPMERLAREGNLAAYLHKGFWHAMDTLRDKNYLEDLWSSGRAPWKKW